MVPGAKQGERAYKEGEIERVKVDKEVFSGASLEHGSGRGEPHGHQVVEAWTDLILRPWKEGREKFPVDQG